MEFVSTCIIRMRFFNSGFHSSANTLSIQYYGLLLSGWLEGLSWGEIITGLRNSHTQLRLVAVYTESGALLLDDTYNASPESTLAALNLLEELDGRKIAVLGDMLELGQYEEEGHELVGAQGCRSRIRIGHVGPRGKIIAQAALKSEMGSCCVHSFDTCTGIVEYLEITR